VAARCGLQVQCAYWSTGRNQPLGALLPAAGRVFDLRPASRWTSTTAAVRGERPPLRHDRPCTRLSGLQCPAHSSPSDPATERRKTCRVKSAQPPRVPTGRSAASAGRDRQVAPWSMALPGSVGARSQVVDSADDLEAVGSEIGSEASAARERRSACRGVGRQRAGPMPRGPPGP